MANQLSIEQQKELASLVEKMGRAKVTRAEMDNQAGVDAGIENITKAGDLAAKAFQDAADEAARRCLQAAEAVMQRATAIETMANQFADRIREMGKEHHRTVTEFAELTATVATTLTRTRELVEGDAPQSPIQGLMPSTTAKTNGVG